MTLTAIVLICFSIMGLSIAILSPRIQQAGIAYWSEREKIVESLPLVKQIVHELRRHRFVVLMRLMGLLIASTSLALLVLLVLDVA